MPWTIGGTHTVSQRPGGSFSHRCPGSSCYAYDFQGEGWLVRASAPGVVVSVDRGHRGQTGPGGAGNNVNIRHADGTCTRYLHLTYASVPDFLVVGTAVGQADPLGLTGNTGYTRPWGRGYHLHFARSGCDTNASIPVDFVEPVLGSGAVAMSLNSPDGEGIGFEGMDGPDGSIVRLYEATFERQPDPGGFVHWRTSGLRIDEMAVWFMGSDEWAATYGELDDVAFVETIYSNVPGRSPDPEGAVYWLGVLGERGRGAVLLGFSESDEFKALTSTG